MTILGENAKVTVEGIEFIVNGDIELNLEREIFEHKLRGKAVVEKIPSKHLSLSGELTGEPAEVGVWTDILSTFLGITEGTLDKTTDISGINIPGNPNDSEITIEFDWGDNDAHVRLTGVVINSVTVSAPQDDVQSVTISFHANGIEKV